MGKDKNRIQKPQQSQQMGTKVNLQQKQPGKDLNPAQRQPQANRNLTNQRPAGVGGANMGGQVKPLKQPYIKENQNPWKDRDKDK